MPGPQRGPRLQSASPQYGTPLPLPLAAAIGVNSLTGTSANLVGTVNPQGLTGTCWFAYGLTPQLGQATATQAISGSLPITVTITARGLTAGQTYYFAMAAQVTQGANTASIVSQPLSFVSSTPAAVTNAGQPVVPIGRPAVSIPHFAFPFSLSATKGAGVVEHGTLEEVFANVQVIANCPAGACPELPTFGVPDMAPAGSVDPRAFIAAIHRWEPRANETAAIAPLGDPNAGAWQVSLTTQYSGAS